MPSLSGLRGVFSAREYAVNQPHGAFALQVEGDTQPTRITTRVALSFSTRTFHIGERFPQDKGIRRRADVGVQQAHRAQEIGP
jgi:hypothetical protein